MASAAYDMSLVCLDSATLGDQKLRGKAAHPINGTFAPIRAKTRHAENGEEIGVLQYINTAGTIHVQSGMRHNQTGGKHKRQQQRKIAIKQARKEA